MIAYGSTVHTALEAAEELDEDIEVLDLRTPEPARLARRSSPASRKTGKVLIAHEATQLVRRRRRGRERWSPSGPSRTSTARSARLTAPDVPIPFSPPLEQAVLPQLDDMKEACRELLAY